MTTKITRIKKIIIFLMGIALLGFLFLIILNEIIYFILGGDQGKFKKYDKGVTIEVKNSSEENITNLTFSFGYLENIHFQELGEIKQIKPGQTLKLTSKSIQRTNADLSMYLQYQLADSKTIIKDSLVYLDIKSPRKVVVLVDITKVDDEGNLFYTYDGYNGFTQYTGETDPYGDN
ncbi:hypothetical protein J2Z40_002939 [Cytobacillus eiseniae]|uniref:Uncharacterized protein n=1 Tax=Cytobacillus eiseniae TaxID=762947 RepID=A0ABS4RHI7_9BACI|nr:hypothetical protein [Cytobacillus eiseniae]MBP2242365.1 hypothetical protein [Cytobacillus eiseniae]